MPVWQFAYLGHFNCILNFSQNNSQSDFGEVTPKLKPRTLILNQSNFPIFNLNEYQYIINRICMSLYEIIIIFFLVHKMFMKTISYLNLSSINQSIEPLSPVLQKFPCIREMTIFIIFMFILFRVLKKTQDIFLVDDICFF